MILYILKRLLLTIPTLILVSLMVFVLVRVMPGDPVSLMLGEDANPEQVALLKDRLGLNEPIILQYFYWLKDILVGNFGHSLTNDLAVGELIIDRFQVSASIVLSAVLLAIMAAVPAGLIAAWKQNSILDLTVVAFATLILSIPSFWLGLIMLLVFSMKLAWFPVIGFVSFADDPMRALLYIVLPVITLALIEAGVLTRMARASAIDVLRLEYVTHARAKGLSEFTVLRRHVLPNSFAGTWTLIGVILGSLLGGIAVIETVFTLPGLGRLLVEAIYGRDYPVIQGCLLFTAGIYVVVNLIIDLFYPVFDPRVTRI
ncbi:MAG: ABC transporter permease [Hyphomicrobiales bacterium]